MRKYLIGTATAAVLSIIGFGVASAAPAPATYDVVPQGVIGGDYSYISLNSGGGTANSYGGGGGGILPFGGGFSGQVVGNYHAIDANHGGGTLSNYDVGGAIAWNNDMGRVGVNVAYTGESATGTTANITNYGGFGEYYANDQFTLGLRGGGVTLSGHTGGLGGFFGSGSTTGGYVGGEVVGYALPDLDFQGHVEYTGFTHGNQTKAGIQAEYLFSESTPISGWVGYDYATLTGGGTSVSSNTVSVGLRFYIGGSGSLLQHHRTGVDGWGPASVNVLF